MLCKSLSTRCLTKVSRTSSSLKPVQVWLLRRLAPGSHREKHSLHDTCNARKKTRVHGAVDTAAMQRSSTNISMHARKRSTPLAKKHEASVHVLVCRYIHTMQRSCGNGHPLMEYMQTMPSGTLKTMAASGEDLHA